MVVVEVVQLFGVVVAVVVQMVQQKRDLVDFPPMFDPMMHETKKKINQGKLMSNIKRK